MAKANKVKRPNIVRGGIAIPLGRNYYYMSGRKHETGGIDIGKNPRTGLEVEDGEIMHIGKNEVKVFSSVPFLNGKSPAQKVIGGENPNKVFNQQEEFKDKHNMNDDGTKRSSRKAKAGGLYTLSVNGKQRLRTYPSTGEIKLSKRQELTGTTVMRNGGRRKARIGTDDDLVKKNDTTVSDYSNNTNPFTLTENTTNPVLERNNEPISSTNVPRAFARRNRDITDPEKLSIAYQKESGTYPNWFKRTYRNVKNYVNKNPETVIDGIGLSSNIIGGLISHKMNRDMLNKLKYNSEPIARKAVKLKTRININPQLDKMRETLAAYEKSVDSNTASSRVALARKQRARLANMLSTNELYGSKENIETELINKDKLNQQSVADANIRDYNDWSEKKAAFNNAVLEKKGENDVSLINTINTGVQDVINRTEKRKSEKQTRLAFIAANPDVNPRILKIMGIKGITDKDIEAYDKAYGKKKKGKKSSDNN